MRIVKLFLGGFLLCFLMAGCSKPTLEEDAKKAAFLTKKSMELSIMNDLKSADNNYREAQNIMDKYRDSDKFMEFHDYYNMYLRELAENAKY